MKVSELWAQLAYVKDFITNGPDFEVKIVVEGVEKDIVEVRAVGADKVLFPQTADEQNRVRIKV